MVVENNTETVCLSVKRKGLQKKKKSVKRKGIFFCVFNCKHGINFGSHVAQ